MSGLRWTGALPAEPLTALLPALQAALQQTGAQQVQLTHGWASSGFADTPLYETLAWQVHALPLAALEGVLRERVLQGFRPGQDDLTLRLPEGLEVHFEGPNLSLQGGDEVLLWTVIRALGAQITLTPDVAAEEEE